VATTPLTTGAPRPALLGAVGAALVVVLGPFVLPSPAGTGAAVGGFLVLLACTGVLVRWRLRRTEAERQLWSKLGASLLAVAGGIVGVGAATALGLPEPAVTAVMCALLLVMMTLTYLGTIRWTRSDPGGSGLDRDHVPNTVCAIVVLVTAAQVVSSLATGGGGLGFGPELPLVVSMAGSLVVLPVLLVTTHGAVARGDLRPTLMAVALVIGIAGSAVVLALDLAIAPWAMVCRAPWPLALAVCAALPEVPHPRERQDVTISSVTGYVVAALALSVVTAAALLGMTGVAVLAGVAAAGSASRVLLDVRELRALVTNRRSSLTDELTGLPNRRGAVAALERTLAERRPLVVALLDLDGFKAVNDSLGHAAGDALLRTVADRLRAVLLPGEVVARLGGDEFLVVAPCGAAAPEARAAELGVAVVHALTAPVQLGAAVVRVGASTGTAVQDDDAGAATRVAETANEAASRLLRAADTAMYEAKRTGAGWVPHDPLRHDDAEGQLALVADLRVALAEHRLVLHHQPQVSCSGGVADGAADGAVVGVADGAVVGVEALVRWPHPVLGLLPPARFLDLAEAHGLMGLLTDEVLLLGVQQQAAWRAAGLRTRLSLNLPASALHDVDLPRRAVALLAAHDVPADAVVLEVPEEVLQRDLERSASVVAALRSAGLRVSIDDFGTGSASLPQLRGVPVDELKLDASFTEALLVDERARAVVASTVQLAHALGVAVVAEGVEDHAVLARLAELGCDAVQGYAVAPPLPAGELALWWPSAAGVGVAARS